MKIKRIERGDIDKHFFVAVLTLLAALAIPEARADGILDTITNHAQTASSSWMNSALGYAKTLFFGLAALEFVWAMTQLVLQKGEMSEVVVGMLMKVITISFFMMLLTYAPDWMGKVRDSFVQAAGGISGTSVSALTPSGMFDKGLDVSARMLNTIPDSLNPFKELFFSIIAGLAALMIVIGYGIIALQLAITLIEMYLVIGAGALMLGFMGSRWTMSFGERYFGYAISTGVKLLTIYLIAAFGDTMTSAITDHLTNIAASRPEGLTPTDMLGLGGASLMFGASGYLVPGIAGSMLNGSPSMSMSNVSAAGKGAASMPVSAALSAGAAGAQALSMGAAGAGALAAKFGGGGGSIAGAPGGGGAGSIFGAPGGGKGGGASPSGGGPAGSISNSPPGGGKSNSGGGSAPGGSKDGNSSNSKDSGSKSSKDGKDAGGGASDGKGSGGGKGNGSTSDRDKTNAGSAQAMGKHPGSSAAAAANSPPGSAPGFQNPNAANSSGPSPRSMDPDRRMHDHMHAGAGGGAVPQQQGKLARLAGVLGNYSREMQYAANRQNTNMGHDGNTGSAPSIRLSI